MDTNNTPSTSHNVATVKNCICCNVSAKVMRLKLLKCLHIICEECMVNNTVEVSSKKSVVCQCGAKTTNQLPDYPFVQPSKDNCSDTYCAHHPKNPMNVFCKSCNTVTCGICQLSKHKNHYYETLDEWSNDLGGRKIKSELLSLKNDIEKNVKILMGSISSADKNIENLNFKKQELNKSIDVAVNSLLDEINNRSAQLKSIIQKHYEKYFNEAKSFKKKVIELQKTGIYYNDFTNLVVNHNKAIDVVKLNKLIKDQLHKVSKLTNAPTYKHIEVFDFNIEKNSMKSAIQAIKKIDVQKSQSPNKKKSVICKESQQNQCSTRQENDLLEEITDEDSDTSRNSYYSNSKHQTSTKTLQTNAKSSRKKRKCYSKADEEYLKFKTDNYSSKDMFEDFFLKHLIDERFNDRTVPELRLKIKKLQRSSSSEHSFTVTTSFIV